MIFILDSLVFHLFMNFLYWKCKVLNGIREEVRLVFVFKLN